MLPSADISKGYKFDFIWIKLDSSPEFKEELYVYNTDIDLYGIFIINVSYSIGV